MKAVVLSWTSDYGSRMFRFWASCIAISGLMVAGAACAKGDGDGSGGNPDASVGGGPDAPVGGSPDAPVGGSPDAPEAKPDAAAPADAAPLADADPAAPDAASAADAGPLGNACTEAQSYPTNDSCAQVYDITAAASMAGGVQLYGDTTGYVNDLEPDSACTNGFGLDGPDAMYRIDATAGQTITAVLVTDTTSMDAGMYILDSCAVATNCLAGVDAVSSTGTENLSYVASTTATHYLLVDSYLSTESGCYALHVTLQ